jgi:hypothetical protein
MGCNDKPSNEFLGKKIKALNQFTGSFYRSYSYEGFDILDSKTDSRSMAGISEKTAILKLKVNAKVIKECRTVNPPEPAESSYFTYCLDDTELKSATVKVRAIPVGESQSIIIHMGCANTNGEGWNCR